MNRLTPAVALLATAVPFLAQANDNYEYPYSGVSGGIATLSDTCDNYSSSCDDQTSFLRVYSGARLLPNFGVEVGYMQSQDFELGPNTDLSTSGLDVTGLVHLPLSGSIDVFGKIGGFFWNTELDASGGSSADESGADIRTGVGAQLGVTDHLYLRADLDYIPDFGNSVTGEDDLSQISGSIQYHF